MNSHRCTSQKSLITIRKWLSEAGDGPSTSFYASSAKSDRLAQKKAPLTKIIHRKRRTNPQYDSNVPSFVSWFYEFIKNVFTTDDERTTDDTVVSLTSCSICHLQNEDSHWKNRLSALNTSKITPKIMITTATSTSNPFTSRLNILHSCKSTQTQLNPNEGQTIICPLYCFSVKDGETSPLLSTMTPVVQEIITSLSPLAISHNSFKYENLPFHSPILPRTSDNHSQSTDHPTNQSTISSNTNLISLQTTENPLDDELSANIRQPSLSLTNTRVCHFDKRNCLIECYHSMNTETKHSSPGHHGSSANVTTPEFVFAESTCQLIKQAWKSSVSDQY